VETLWWGTILVFYSGRWLRRAWTAFLLGAITGWTYWCEPFILFFTVPVLAHEFWGRGASRPEAGKAVLSILAGLGVGLLGGYQWNGAFTRLGPLYLHWAPKNWEGIRWNLSLLWGAFPQFWNGNLPFSYLQNSSLGLSLIPVTGGNYPAFLGFWTLATTLFGLWGLRELTAQNTRESRWQALLAAGPAFLYLSFFIIGSQVWDANSFRYAAFWAVWAAVGFGLGFHFIYLKKPQVALVLAGIFVLTQSLIIAQKYQKISDIPPALVVARGFQAVGIKAGYASHWVAEAGRYLSNDEVMLNGYISLDQKPTSWRSWKAVHEESRIGIAVLDGLDQPPRVQELVSELEKGGYQSARIWPMMGDWEIVEMDRVPSPPVRRVEPKQKW
jgi:FtsH-binding integral membrane protein